MTTSWSSEEPSSPVAGESEEGFPAQEHFDDGAREPVDSGSPVSLSDAGDSYESVNDVVDADEAEDDGAGAEPLDAEQQMQADIEELTARAQRADEYLQIAQRTQADFENYRKRAARDAALAQDRGVAKLAKELLPAIDNLERAVHAALGYASAPAGADAQNAGLAGDAQIVDGLRLVHAELLAALGRAGIAPFSPVGEQFDPQHHEAVAQNRVDGTAAGTVIEVYQQGYRLGETVLRPARVLVAA